MKSKWSAMVVIAGLLLLAGCGALKEADPRAADQRKKRKPRFLKLNSDLRSPCFKT
ncbi:hypothetical protein [Bacillus licheniformis]|uniref:hypothetical protein n=1 Tax=Bacillus licheniformis TaxID=1402 RepID=UPI00142F6081|nr:hypothetical protein [Bacillus licheniformis]